MAGTRNYQSIGEVLVNVKTEFPDITISKIRFLESEGLITPSAPRPATGSSMPKTSSGSSRSCGCSATSTCH